MIIATAHASGTRRGRSTPRRRADRPLSLDCPMTDEGLCFLDLVSARGPSTSPLEMAETLADLVAPLTVAQRNAVCRVILDGDEPGDLSPVDRRCLDAGLARLRDLHGVTPETAVR